MDVGWNVPGALILTILPRGAVMATMMVLHPHVHIWHRSDGNDRREDDVIGGRLTANTVGELLSVVGCVIHNVEVTHLIFTGGSGGCGQHNIHM